MMLSKLKQNWTYAQNRGQVVALYYQPTPPPPPPPHPNALPPLRSLEGHSENSTIPPGH